MASARADEGEEGRVVAVRFAAVEVVTDQLPSLNLPAPGPNKPTRENQLKAQSNQNQPTPTTDNQHPTPQAMEIFQTTNNRGHGVRAARPIRRGEFVVEYAGEVIDVPEMQRRMDAQRVMVGCGGGGGV